MKHRYRAHYGKSCPVIPGTRIEVLRRDGRVEEYESVGLKYAWLHLGMRDDIVAYRVVNACNP